MPSEKTEAGEETGSEFAEGPLLSGSRERKPVCRGPVTVASSKERAGNETDEKNALIFGELHKPAAG